MSYVNFCKKKSCPDINMYVYLEKHPYWVMGVYRCLVFFQLTYLLIVLFSTCVVFVIKQ